MATVHLALEARFPKSTSRLPGASFARGLTKRTSNQNVKNGEVDEVEVV
jgi:hypothetical protein